MRLQVFLSHNGICSRREAMTVIQSGRVKVNGRTIKEPSFDVQGGESILVDGHPVAVKKYTYVMLNKPVGFTTTKDDPHAEKIVLDLLPKDLHHVSPVGRLDQDSEGFLLLTNDGALAHRLMHPRFHLDKIYVVHVKGRLSTDTQKKLEQGITIEDEKTAPCRIHKVRYNGPHTEFEMTIHEGKKRQIRRMLISVGHVVYFLKRISIGPLGLGDLKVGQWRHLTQQEVGQLKRD